MFFLFQRLCGWVPFVTSGPFAHFFGGASLLSSLEQGAPSGSQYYSLVTACLSSLLLHVTLTVYKRAKNHGGGYEIALRQQALTGQTCWMLQFGFLEKCCLPNTFSVSTIFSVRPKEIRQTTIRASGSLRQ